MIKFLEKYYGGLRRLKASYLLFNRTQAKYLKKQAALYKKHGIRKSVYASVQSSDFAHLPDERPWLDHENAADRMKESLLWPTFSAQLQEALLKWSEEGFVLLKAHFAKEFIDALNAEIDRLLEDKTIQFNYTGRKIMFAFRYGEKLAKVAYDGDIQRIINFLMGAKMVPFQSINFTKSSEQRAHSDSVHMTTYPLGYMCASWTALEDIGADQGPLIYYPGSHKLPYVLNNSFDHGGSKYFLGKEAYLQYEEHIQELIRTHNLEPVEFHPEAGDVFIWHGNLLHGARTMNRAELTRKSMVVHFFNPEAICYHELTQRPAIIKTS
jgi:ectoine hydroxylase